MIVLVRAPEVHGDTVTFRWNSSEPNPLQRMNSFSFRYENVDLARFTDDLFYEMFLALQLKVFSAFNHPVTLRFPTPICALSVAFWKAYHDAENVAVETTHRPTAYSPWRIPPLPSFPRGLQAVFFGGGKESLLSAELLAEIEGRENILLIQYIHPLRPRSELAERLQQRQEALMLRPARDLLGFSTQRVWTDYQSNIPKHADQVRPHLELFSAGALPVMLARGVQSCVWGAARTAYEVVRKTGGEVRYHYANSRPEVMATLSSHYRRALGIDLSVSCVTALFTPLMARMLLAERFPAAHRQAVSCTTGGISEPWCYRCHKCSGFALFGLRFGVIDPRFDYDWFYRESAFIKEMLAYAATGPKPGKFGNARWIPAWTWASHAAENGHSLANLEPRGLADHVGPEAAANVRTLIALFGNHRFPYVEQLARSSIDWVGTDHARRVGAIAANVFEVVDDLSGPFPHGNGEVTFDFRIVMPTRTGLLDHIRS